MKTFKDITEVLKRCDLSDSYCDSCRYKDESPNECIKHLHLDARHILQDSYEMAEFYLRKYEEEKGKCTCEQPVTRFPSIGE